VIGANAIGGVVKDNGFIVGLIPQAGSLRVPPWTLRSVSATRPIWSLHFRKPKNSPLRF